MKRKREEDKEKTEKTNHNINKYFATGVTAAVPKAKVKVSRTFGIQTFNKLIGPCSLRRLLKMLPSWPISSTKSTPTSYRVRRRS